MPFFGNSIVAPTAFSRVKSLAVDGSVLSNTVSIRGTSFGSEGGGSYEFDIGLGQIRRISHAADIVCDITTAGPTINGRDQAGAFTISTFIYLYLLLKTSDGATIGAVWSASPPSVGPTLPSGWQSPVYAGAYKLDATPQLLGGRRRNNWLYDTANASALVNTASAPTVQQTVSYAAQAPITAIEIMVQPGASTNTITQSTIGGNTFSLSTNASNPSMSIQQLQNQVAAQPLLFTNRHILPVLSGQNIFWQWAVAGVTSAPNTNFNIVGYAEPLT